MQAVASHLTRAAAPPDNSRIALVEDGRYLGLLDAAPDALVVVNLDDEIVFLNFQAERLFGYRRDALIGEKISRIIPHGFAARLVADVLDPADKAPMPEGGAMIELVARRKDGREFPVEVMLSRSLSGDGILVTSAIRDISTRKAAEAELRKQVEELNRSNEALVQFAYVASHDLQEPLRAVAISVARLEEKYAGVLDAEAGQCIGLAVGGAERMRHLIDDLLNYSRVSTRRSALADTASEEALENALLNLRGAIDETHAQVTHGPLPVVSADPRQLTQLFQNLIGNAIKFQGGGVPRIHVAAVRDGEEKWTFTVSDNGIGIDPKNFDRIFGMFQRLHRRTDYGGSGIGLAICKKIVEQHGGTISVESQPNKGSTFRFTLGGATAKPLEGGAANLAAAVRS